MSDPELKKKIDEMFMDKAYDVFKQYHETHSKTLQSIYETQNGYSRFWKWMRGNGGAITTILGFITIIGSVWGVFIRIDYRMQAIEVEAKRVNEVIEKMNVKTTSSLETLSKVLGEHNGRISKIEGKLETKKTE